MVRRNRTMTDNKRCDAKDVAAEPAQAVTPTYGRKHG
jgi:hypothetical protein